MAVIPSTYRLVLALCSLFVANIISYANVACWAARLQHRDVPPRLATAARRLTDVPKPASYLVEVAIWYFLAVL
jgi:hypothetical protein